MRRAAQGGLCTSCQVHASVSMCRNLLSRRWGLMWTRRKGLVCWRAAAARKHMTAARHSLGTPPVYPVSRLQPQGRALIMPCLRLTEGD